MSHKNGGPVSRAEFEELQQRFRTLAELTIQCDERIEQLWDLMIEIRLGIADEVGVKLKNDKEWRYAAQERAKCDGIQKIQRQRLRKSWGLT